MWLNVRYKMIKKFIDKKKIYNLRLYYLLLFCPYFESRIPNPEPRTPNPEPRIPNVFVCVFLIDMSNFFRNEPCRKLWPPDSNQEEVSDRKLVCY